MYQSALCISLHALLSLSLLRNTKTLEEEVLRAKKRESPSPSPYDASARTRNGTTGGRASDPRSLLRSRRRRKTASIHSQSVGPTTTTRRELRKSQNGTQRTDCAGCCWLVKVGKRDTQQRERDTQEGKKKIERKRRREDIAGGWWPKCRCSPSRTRLLLPFGWTRLKGVFSLIVFVCQKRSPISWRVDSVK